MNEYPLLRNRKSNALTRFETSKSSDAFQETLGTLIESSKHTLDWGNVKITKTFGFLV